MNSKTFFSIFAVLFFTAFASYASFPVQRANTNNATTTITVEKDNNDLSSPAAVGGDKSQVTALILAVLIGGLGIHRFYLGYTWQGVVQLLTLGGLGIWSLIDLIRIITGDLQPKDGSYSKTL